jgi:aminoglycoside 6'-N-acetyltransferase
LTFERLERPPYLFRGVARSDLPALRQWLKTPDVARWWGDPDEQIALIEEDLGVAAMAQWIVSFETRPFAYAQAYEVHAWPQAHLDHLPQGAMAIDAFVGDSGMIGRGHGAGFLRVLAERLLREGAPVVAIDPDVDNHRARRAYRKAGFRDGAVAQTPAGAVALMIFDRGSRMARERSD